MATLNQARAECTENFNISICNTLRCDKFLKFVQNRHNLLCVRWRRSQWIALWIEDDLKDSRKAIT